MTLLSRLKTYYLSLRLPWRKRLLIGTDLENNTYWEFRHRINASRPRRTVVFADKSKDWVDYASAVSPQWHQWLRNTRADPPSLSEQQADIERRRRLRGLAALADARWESKASVLNAGPHPPVDSVLESNTKFCNDSGLQRRRDVGRGEVGGVLGGKMVEGVRREGEHAPPQGKGEDVADMWLPKSRGRTRDEVGGDGVLAGEDARRLKRRVEGESARR